MKTTHFLFGFAFAALLVASPVAGMINFTFDRTTVDNDGSPNYTIDSPFTITQDGLTLTGSIGGTGNFPRVFDTGVEINPNNGADVFVLEFDKPVVVESVTIGNLRFTTSSSMKITVDGTSVVNEPITFATPDEEATYSMPTVITDIELTPGVNDFRINGNNESFMDISEIAVTVVPEPESAGILLGVAGLAFVFARRRRS